MNSSRCRYNAWSQVDSRSHVLDGGQIATREETILGDILGNRQPPTVTYLSYRVSGSTLTAVGRSQSLARWPGTHSRILSGIQRAAQTVLGVYLKRTCWRVTSASSALAVLNDYALYKSTHSLTHSLIHRRVGAVDILNAIPKMAAAMRHLATNTTAVSSLLCLYC